MKHILLLIFLLVCKVSYGQSKNTTIKVLWFDTSIDSLRFNENYFKSSQNNERAAIAYVALYDSRDCEWDGEANADHSNLSCKIIKVLGLGHQCSKEHLEFLTHWFRDDTSILNEIKFCPITPNTAHSVQGVDKILLTRMPGKKFKIFYAGSGADLAAMKGWSFSETLIFKTESDKVILISRKRSKVKIDKLTASKRRKLLQDI